MSLQAERAALIESIRTTVGPGDDVLRAMESVPREDFVPPDVSPNAYADVPLALGWGSTISQPTMVAILLAELKLSPGLRVLEIGSGCGYLLALLERLACIAIGVEIIEQLAVSSAETLERLGFTAKVIGGDASRVAPDGPFDRILFSAAIDRVPAWATDRTSPDGFVLAPIGAPEMQMLTRTYRACTEPTGFPCRFVRFVT